MSLCRRKPAAVSLVEGSGSKSLEIETHALAAPSDAKLLTVPVSGSLTI